MSRPSVAIVGAGFSGIGMAIALKRDGIEDFTVYERADAIGGVWHHNTYPAAACDVPSYLYSYSFEQRRDWSTPCSPQPEILAYLHQTAHKHGVDSHVRTRTEVASARWDERARRWTVTTATGDAREFDVLVLACGQLSRPAYPRIEGAESFAGDTFHSAEWRHDVPLAGRRVAVVGTGASAVQFVPEVARVAAHLDVYQRTPNYMLPRRNPRYPALVRALFEHVPGLQRLRRLGLYAFMELFVLGLTRVALVGRLLEAWSLGFLLFKVRDRELRRRLYPRYAFGCKRILFSSYFYEALQRNDVDLVTRRIARMTPAAIVTDDGVEHPTDVVIYGTGFRAHDFVLPMRVQGAGGRDLQAAWSDGAEAHLGIAVAGFPNAFLLYGPNTNLGVGSIIVMIEAQVRYVLDALHTLERSGARALTVRPEVQRASGDAVQERLRESVWTRCQSWYRDDSGRVVNNWPGFMTEYVRATEAMDPQEYELIA